MSDKTNVYYVPRAHCGHGKFVGGYWIRYIQLADGRWVPTRIVD